jgi:formylglycine-generating enzyme required for sulfatase activity
MTSLLVSLALTSAAALADWPNLANAPIGVARDGANDAALIIAIEDYVIPGVPDVPGARDNATAWRSYLKDVRGVSVVKVLTDAAASREGMLEAAGQIRARVKPGGRVWLVYIGHGAPSKERSEGLLVGADAQQNATSLYARSLPQSELLRALGARDGVPVVAVLDACFSGSTADGRLVEGLQPLLPVALLQDSAASTATVLSAGKGDQFAGPLPGLGQPAFSWLVLGAMRGWGDADGNGAVTAREAIDFANDRLAELVNDRRQEPEVVGQVDVQLGKGRERAPALDTFIAARRPSPLNVTPVAPLVTSNSDLPRGETGTVNDDIATLARAREARAAREKRLTELAAAKRAEGAATWKELSAALSEGSPTEVSIVEKYVKAWSNTQVWVQDAEGRHPRDVAIAEVDEARRWLVNTKLGRTERDWNSPSLGTMKWIPAGTFTMGSPTDETHHEKGDPASQHTVTVTRGYWMMDHEVTQAEWRTIMRDTPVATGSWQAYGTTGEAGSCGRVGIGPDLPVVCVDWHMAVEFARKASVRDGVEYALPTEAQWEYAARGGGTHPFGARAEGMELCEVANVANEQHIERYRDLVADPGADDLSGWSFTSCDDGVAGLATVRRYKPNGFGLYDMVGNVWEWTDDWSDAYPTGAVSDPRAPEPNIGLGWKIRRGGSWSRGPEHARVAYRRSSEPNLRFINVGFRLVRVQK